MSALTIRSRIVLFQLMVGAAVVAMFVAGLLTMRTFNSYLTRGAFAHEQLALVTSLARDADEYSEKLARLLVTGDSEPAEIATLQSRLASGFAALEQSTVAERTFLLRSGEAGVEDSELQRASTMRELYDDMNRRFEALLIMREGGRSEAAARVFYREIDGGLDDALESILDTAIASEMQEIEEADAEAGSAAHQLQLLIALTSAMVIVAAALAGYALYRSIVRPIKRLTAGAVAIGKGDLSQRVGPLGKDEFGLLAERFDEMASEISTQQTLLIAARSTLEAEVEARTAELRVANDTLTNLDRSRVRFLADVSHELRTPLTIMRGEAEVTLRDKAANVTVHRATLEQILQQAREMGRLVDDLMFLARSETGDVAFESEILDLREIVAEAAREAAILGESGGIEIVARLDELPPVKGDGKRMKQLMMIILDNAVKYSAPRSSVTLLAQAEPAAALLSVRNRGAQIGEEELPRIFDRFYRGRGAAEGGSGGMGLGLSIARWIVERQGGAIAVQRPDPDVIEVAIRFPAAREHAEAEPWSAAAE